MTARVVSKIPNDPWLRTGLFQNPGDLAVDRAIALAIAREIKLRAGQSVGLNDPALMAAVRRLDPHGAEFAIEDAPLRLWRYDAAGKVVAHISPYPVRRRQ
jgi:hypothetical protein